MRLCMTQNSPQSVSFNKYICVIYIKLDKNGFKAKLRHNINVFYKISDKQKYNLASFNTMQTRLNTVQRGVLWISRCRSSNDADPSTVAEILSPLT
jgi:hypothetical protein